MTGRNVGMDADLFQSRAPLESLPLFADPIEPQLPPPHLKKRARSPDRETSIEAAEKAHGAGPRLRQEILEAFRTHGPMNDGELELLPELAWVNAQNSIRRTRTTLLQDGLLEASGFRRGHPHRPESPMTVWKLK